MTDLEQVRAMLDRAGIPYVERPSPNAGDTRLHVERGYAGFYALFTFRPDGALRDLEAYE